MISRVVRESTPPGNWRSDLKGILQNLLRVIVAAAIIIGVVMSVGRKA